MARSAPAEGSSRPLPVEVRMRHAPVERGLGMHPVDDGGDQMVLRAPLHDGVCGPDGRVAPVLVALLADSGIGFLIFTSSGLSAGAPTMDLRIDHLGPAAPDATAVTATLALLHLDDEAGVGRAELRDDTGRPIAHAVATMAMTGVPAHPGGLAGETAGEIGGATDFRAGRPPFDPAWLAPDSLPTDPEDGTVVFTPGASATNLNGTTHGAVLAGLARGAQDRFLAGSGATPAVRHGRVPASGAAGHPAARAHRAGPRRAPVLERAHRAGAARRPGGRPRDRQRVPDARLDRDRGTSELMRPDPGC